MLDVDVGGRDEGVDARPLGVADRLPCTLYVAGVDARKPGDDRPTDLAGDHLDGLEVTGRGDRKAGLDHIDAEPGELMRDLELLDGVERDAGRLLAVAQRRVEDQYSVWVRRRHVMPLFGLATAFSSMVCGSAAATQISP